MITLLYKLFSQPKNINSLNLAFQKLRKETEVNKIFKVIEEFSKTSEIRYVGGCIRKAINNEVIDDVYLAVNLNPDELSEILKKNNIKFYSTGIEHGTITALIDKKKFGNQKCPCICHCLYLCHCVCPDAVSLSLSLSLYPIVSFTVTLSVTIFVSVTISVICFLPAV